MCSGGWAIAAGLLSLGLHREERVGILSNTLWPAAEHERIFVRDGVAHLIDGAVYSSEIAFTKPDRRAFLTALAAVGVPDPARAVFVGDRLFDDVWGAHNAGLRAIHIPLSNIPVGQVGHTEGEPDASVTSLADVPAAVRTLGRVRAQAPRRPLLHLCALHEHATGLRFRYSRIHCMIVHVVLPPHREGSHG